MATATTATQPLRIVIAARDIKLAHSVFAMPFAVLGAFLARAAGEPADRFIGQVALVVVAMVAARTWAMLVNRLADRKIDAENPRTARRAFASGALSTRYGVLLLLASAGVFILAAAGFGVAFENWWPALLSAPVLAWIAFYSFTKRFTWLCHLMLGGALAASPLAAGIAVRPEYLLETATLFWLAGMVACWVAGFDVIYALQDLDFDRQTRLHSIPARFGPRGAIWISRSLHAVALAALVLAWFGEPRFGALTAAAIAVVAGLLIAEHAVLARRGQNGLNLAFFTLNGVVSCVLGAAGAVDTLL